jgi:hypothetical protein
MTTIQNIIKDCLKVYINQHGKLIAKNSIGYQMTLYGYIRKVENDFIEWEHNDYSGKKYKIKNIVSFEPIDLKEK